MIARAGLCAAALGLWQCELKTSYRPRLPDQASFKVHHHGVYATRMGGEGLREIPGTIFETRLACDLKREGATWSLKRRLDTMVARGYHKLSMPNELELKIDLEIVLDSTFAPVGIKGYDSLRAVLGRTQQKDSYRKQLMASLDPQRAAAAMRDWWRMAAMLPKDVDIEPRKPVSVEEVNKRLETRKLDSARFDGPLPRGMGKGRRNCLDFTVYYERVDSLPLLVEQFFFSHIQNRKYQRHTWKPAVVKGHERFSVDRATGLPCFHSISEIADITLEKKDEKSEFPIQVTRYEEDIFEH